MRVMLLLAFASSNRGSKSFKSSLDDGLFGVCWSILQSPITIREPRLQNLPQIFINDFSNAIWS